MVFHFHIKILQHTYKTFLITLEHHTGMTPWGAKDSDCPSYGFPVYSNCKANFVIIYTVASIFLLCDKNDKNHVKNFQEILHMIVEVL